MNVENKLNWIRTLSIFSAVVAGIILLLPAFTGTQKFEWGNASEVASAVATTAVLLVGILAVTIVVAVESAEFKATEQVKVDLLTLAASITSIMRKVGASEALHTELPHVELESSELQKFSAGITALALQSWSEKKPVSKEGKPINLLNFFICLGHAIVILRSPQEGGLNTYKCASYLAPMHLILAELTEAHIVEIAKELANIDTAVSKSLAAAARDPFIGRVLQVHQQRETGRQENEQRIRDLKAQGIDDPDLDLWMAVLDNKVPALEDAIKRGANAQTTMETLLHRHQGRHAA